MKKDRFKKLNTIPTKLIAPCGMNCRLCRAYIRDKNTCSGCRGDNNLKPKYCIVCKIKICQKVAKGDLKYCFDCGDFPCTRLKNLDKRYRKRYAMSMIDNLRTIKDFGVRQFIRNEKERWTCPKCRNLVCVHKPKCLFCGYEWYP